MPDFQYQNIVPAHLADSFEQEKKIPFFLANLIHPTCRLYKTVVLSENTSEQSFKEFSQPVYLYFFYREISGTTHESDRKETSLPLFSLWKKNWILEIIVSFRSEKDRKMEKILQRIHKEISEWPSPLKIHVHQLIFNENKESTEIRVDSKSENNSMVWHSFYEKEISDFLFLKKEDFYQPALHNKKTGTRFLQALVVLIFGLQYLWFPGGEKAWISHFGVSLLSFYHENYFYLLIGVLTHGGVLHMLFNVLVFDWIGNIAERYFHPFVWILLFLISAAGGVLTSLLFLSPQGLSVGISGALFGLLGVMLSFFIQGSVFSFGFFKLQSQLQVKTLTVFILLQSLLPFFVDKIDSWGHTGGLIIGFFCGFILHSKRFYLPVHTTAPESSLSEPPSGGSGLQGTGKPLAYIFPPSVITAKNQTSAAKNIILFAFLMRFSAFLCLCGFFYFLVFFTTKRFTEPKFQLHLQKIETLHKKNENAHLFIEIFNTKILKIMNLKSRIEMEKDPKAEKQWLLELKNIIHTLRANPKTPEEDLFLHIKTLADLLENPRRKDLDLLNWQIGYEKKLETIVSIYGLVQKNHEETRE